MAATVNWPRGLSITRFERQPDVCRFLFQVGAQVLSAACVLNSEGKQLIERLLTDEAVFHRITMISVAGNSYNRVASSPYLRLNQWQDIIKRSYSLKDNRPELRPTMPNVNTARDGRKQADDQCDREIRNHQEMKINSVIDVHLWDSAKWLGCGYLQIRYDHPPIMAFLFENAQAGKKIFERWRARFGEKDEDEEIALAVIRNIPDADPHHYCVQIASKPPKLSEQPDGRSVIVATRSMTMEPATDKNLEMFLAGVRRFGAYFLVPATGNDGSGFFTELSILKRDISVKSAADIGEHDIEALAMRIRGISVAS